MYPRMIYGAARIHGQHPAGRIYNAAILRDLETRGSCPLPTRWNFIICVIPRIFRPRVVYLANLFSPISISKEERRARSSILPCVLLRASTGSWLASRNNRGVSERITAAIRRNATIAALIIGRNGTGDTKNCRGLERERERERERRDCELSLSTGVAWGTLVAGRKKKLGYADAKKGIYISDMVRVTEPVVGNLHASRSLSR